MTKLCEARRLTVRYGSNTVLRDVDFSVGQGQMIALVGPSGAGKTTLLLSLAGLVKPAAGAVFFDGVNITECTIDERADIRLRQFGFVMQGGELMPELTLRENVALPLRLAGSSARSATRAADDFLEKLDVGSSAGRLPGEVSGGQAQRAAVARALIHGPQMVFADEPTGALDTDNGESVFTALLDTVRDANAGLIMVTHDRALAARLPHLVEMRDGETRPAGNHSLVAASSQEKRK